MSNNLVGFGSADGLGSSCGCYGSRRAGMAGYGAGPDGLGTVSSDALLGGVTVALLGVLAASAAVGGTVGYFVGGYVGSRSKGKSGAMIGATAGAATGAITGVVRALLSP